MTFRSPVTLQDKLYSCLLYAIPMASATLHGSFIFNQIPFLQYAFEPLIFLDGILNIPVIPQLISVDSVAFLCIYFFVVRNIGVSHFIRFNAMQSILLGILLVLIQVLISMFLSPLLRSISSLQFLLEVIFNTIFIGMTAACIYATVQTIRGMYAEMPVVSDAAYYQVPR
jgi:uncharacterized membrane protein